VTPRPYQLIGRDFLAARTRALLADQMRVGKTPQAIMAADKLGAERVLVLSIPDWGVTPFAAAQPRAPTQIAHEIDAYNASARAIAQRHGVPFVDITDLSRERPNDPGMLAADGLHPGPTMHARWAERALPIATHLFSR